MDINWKFIGHLILAVAMCIGMMAVITGHASATTNESYVEVIYPDVVTVTPTETPVIPPYITQGSVVYIGDTYDVSGVVPPYPQLAYWDGFDMYDTAPKYNFTMPDAKIGYYKFNITEETFGSRLGKWYKYGGEYERQGNNLAFIVKRKPMTNYTQTLQNGTVLNMTRVENVTYVPYVVPKTPILPDKRVADFLVTREEPFNVSVNEISAVWIFNSRNNDIIYSANNTPFDVVFNKSEIGYMEPGDYKVVIQKIGNNTGGLDMLYDKSTSTIKWFDRDTFKVNSVDATNLEPESAIKLLKQIFPHIPDSYEIKTLAVQDPEISIVKMDKKYSAAAKEYFHDIDLRGNVTIMDVVGYTNVQPGTNITVTLDETKIDPRSVAKTATFKGKAEGDYLGDMRQYRVYVPLYWDTLAPGVHTLTARTEKGGVIYADFVVSEIPADSYVPENTVRYIEDRNPWVPTPTPEVVKVVQTVEVPKTIEVPVPPSDDQVKQAQKKLADENWNRTVLTTIEVVVGAVVVVVLFFGAGYLISVYRRVKKND